MKSLESREFSDEAKKTYNFYSKPLFDLISENEKMASYGKCLWCSNPAIWAHGYCADHL